MLAFELFGVSWNYWKQNLQKIIKWIEVDQFNSITPIQIILVQKLMNIKEVILEIDVQRFN